MGASVDIARGRGRTRYRQRAEINVTPLVDVMLVLLIIFMITAPLLTVGVEVELPRTQAQNLAADQEPITVTVKADGSVFIQETETPVEELTPRLLAIAQTGYSERIFIRADGSANYASVIDVMARLKNAGFENMGLVTDPLTQTAAAAAADE